MFVNGLGQNVQSLERTAHRCFLPSFRSFGQAVSEEKIKKNRPIRNKNCLWRPCLLMDRDEISNLYRGPSIDASYQVSGHLAEGFQRRRLKWEKLTNDRRQTTDASDGKSSHCLWQGELKSIYIKGNVDVVRVYFLIISSYVYIIGCGMAVTADVVGYSQITTQSYKLSVYVNRIPDEYYSACQPLYLLNSMYC